MERAITHARDGKISMDEHMFKITCRTQAEKNGRKRKFVDNQRVSATELVNSKRKYPKR